MKFKFKVQNSKNEIIEGVKDSSDKFTLARELRDAGDTPILIEEFKEKGGILSLDIKMFDSVSLSEKLMFTRNLSGMLSAGLSVNRALSILDKQSSNKYFKNIMQSLSDDINKGNTLSDGMKKYPKIFSGIFIPMVRSGEESGGLPNALTEVGSTLKKAYDLNKKIKSALMYPSIIVCAIILIATLMMIYVVPTLTATFKDTGSELPSSTKLVIWISDTLSQHTLIFLFVVFLIVGAGITFAKLKFTQKYFDYIILHLPIIGGIAKEVNTARTARTLSSLLISGVNISRALSITEEVLQNFHYKKIIHQSIESIEKGMTLSSGFKENINLYPVMMGEMIEVGEETGNLSKMLLDVADFYEAEVESKTKDLSTIIEPVLMVFIGAAVGFFAVSMISPMYSVMDNIK